MTDHAAWATGMDLSKLIDREGRIIEEARMLAKDGSLSEKRRGEIIESVKAHMERHKITQAQVAREIGGLSASNLSAILSGSYDHAKLDEHLSSLNNWVEVDARRRATRPDSTFVETHVARLLMGCARKVIEFRCIGLAHGPTGIGKTMVAHVIAERFPGTIYFMAGEGLSSYTSVRRAVANHLRLYSTRVARKHASMTLNDRVLEKLRGSGRLILIDEAHQLDDGAINYLRTLHDQCGVPVMFMCTVDLLHRVRRDNDEDHGQVYSRVGYVCDVTRGRDKTPGGKKPLFTLNEVRALFENEQIKLAPDAQAYLQDVANTLGQGSLRRCKYVLQWAVMIERNAKGLRPKDRMTITAVLLQKAETEPLADESMLEDIRARTAALAASA